MRIPPTSSGACRLASTQELTKRGIPRTGTPNAGGPIVTASGLVFIGSTTDAQFRAFDSQTGKELWASTIPNDAIATPLTYMGRGENNSWRRLPAVDWTISSNPPSPRRVRMSLSRSRCRRQVHFRARSPGRPRRNARTRHAAVRRSDTSRVNTISPPPGRRPHRRDYSDRRWRCSGRNRITPSAVHRYPAPVHNRTNTLVGQTVHGVDRKH